MLTIDISRANARGGGFVERRPSLHYNKSPTTTLAKYTATTGGRF